MQSHTKSSKLTWHLLFSVLLAGTVFFLIWTINHAIIFFGIPSPPWHIKRPLMASVTGLFLMVYAIFLLLYSKWAKKAKLELEYLYKLDKRVLFEKYNRIFVNEELISYLGHNPSSLKKLSQKDKRDIFNTL